jgi:D-sedoheptulose 7-phosphate isomerase
MSIPVLNLVEQAVEAITRLKTPEALLFLEQTADLLAQAFRRGNKVLIAGNGGSLCDATHFAEELTGFFQGMRPALPAIALADPGHLTCVANDMGFEWVFARSVAAYGQQGDVFIALTTSGRSPNLIRAMEEAKQRQMHTIAFLGKDGGDLRGMAQLELLIEGFTTSDRIQEAHMAALHIIVALIEQRLFSKALNDASWN